MNNQDIKQEIKEANLFFYQIAEKLDINDGNFSRRLRKELPEAEKQRIRAIISELIKEREEVQ